MSETFNNRKPEVKNPDQKPKLPGKNFGELVKAGTLVGLASLSLQSQALANPKLEPLWKSGGSEPVKTEVIKNGEIEAKIINALPEDKQNQIATQAEAVSIKKENNGSCTLTFSGNKTGFVLPLIITNKELCKQLLNKKTFVINIGQITRSITIFSPVPDKEPLF
jgi:hypothetical protein